MSSQESEDSADEINVNVAFQQHVMKKNVTVTENNQQVHRHKRQVKKEGSSDLEEPRSPNDIGLVAAA